MVILLLLAVLFGAAGASLSYYYSQLEMLLGAYLGVLIVSLLLLFIWSIRSVSLIALGLFGGAVLACSALWIVEAISKRKRKR